MLNGVARGLELILDYLKLRYKARTTHNAEMNAALDSVEEIWFMELTGFQLGSKQALSAGIKNTLLFALLTSDPFADSRHALQAVKVQYGV